MHTPNVNRPFFSVGKLNSSVTRKCVHVYSGNVPIGVWVVFSLSIALFGFPAPIVMWWYGSKTIETCACACACTTLPCSHTFCFTLVWVILFCHARNVARMRKVYPILLFELYSLYSLCLSSLGRVSLKPSVELLVLLMVRYIGRTHSLSPFLIPHCTEFPLYCVVIVSVYLLFMLISGEIMLRFHRCWFHQVITNTLAIPFRSCSGLDMTIWSGWILHRTHTHTHALTSRHEWKRDGTRSARSFDPKLCLCALVYVRAVVALAKHKKYFGSIENHFMYTIVPKTIYCCHIVAQVLPHNIACIT